MASGMWATLARLLGLGQPGQTRTDEQRRRGSTRVTTRTWGRGRGPSTSPKPTAPKPTAPKPAPPRSAAPKPAAPKPGPPAQRASSSSYAGDFTGKAKLAYAPEPDGDADPGEVVWAWVPFEEDYTQGKDRPVLVIARHCGKLLGLMLTSKDHDRDAAQEAHHGRFWLDIGTGAWDRQNRPSEVRLDRILQLDPKAVRREGAALPEPLYNEIATAVRRTKRW